MLKKNREKLDDWLWGSNWYPWIWDHTYGPFFRRYKTWTFHRDLAEMFGGEIPEVGDIICDCRYRHLKIVEKRSIDDVILEDGANCSLWNCCSPVDHVWEHPTNEELRQFQEEAQRELTNYETTVDGASVIVHLNGTEKIT